MAKQLDSKPENQGLWWWVMVKTKYGYQSSIVNTNRMIFSFKANRSNGYYWLSMANDVKLRDVNHMSCGRLWTISNDYKHCWYEFRANQNAQTA